MPARRKARPGHFLRQCDRTGFTVWDDETTKEWDGAIVWDRVFEPRQPQDFIRGVEDDPSVPDPRPLGTATFIGPLIGEINASQIAGDTSITLLDTTRMSISDRLSIALDNGDVFFTTIQSVDSGTALTIAAGLPAASSAGNRVVDYTAVSAATLS